jgi:integrase
MPITHNRTRYQEGTLELVKRVKGPDVWVYRWRETSPTGTRVQRKRVIGTVDKLKTETAAKKSVENLRLAVNAADSKPVDAVIDRVTVGGACRTPFRTLHA